MKRQAWQDLRLRFVISHSFVAGQLYSMLPVTESTGKERYSESLINTMDIRSIDTITVVFNFGMYQE